MNTIICNICFFEQDKDGALPNIRRGSKQRNGRVRTACGFYVRYKSSSYEMSQIVPVQGTKTDFIERNGKRIQQTTITENGVISVYEAQPTCCCTVSTLVSTTTYEMPNNSNAADTINDLDIFLSTTEVIGDMQVIKNFGMVSTTYTGTRSRFSQGNYNMATVIANSAAGVESVRSHALASLRARAKLIGANAVIGVRIDLENTEFGGDTISVAIATGTAVLLLKLPHDITSSEFKYPPYMPTMQDR